MAIKNKKEKKESEKKEKRVKKTAVSKITPEKKSQKARSTKKTAESSLKQKVSKKKSSVTKDLKKNIQEKESVLGQQATLSKEIVKEQVDYPNKENVATKMVDKGAAGLIKEEIKDQQKSTPPSQILESKTPESQIPQEPSASQKTLKPIELDLPITLKDLSVKLQEKPSLLIKYLIEKQRKFVSINQILDEEIVRKTLQDYGFELLKKKSDTEIIEQKHIITAADKLQSRPPVVTLMGHVDHGKTSLLDAIRKSKIADKEHGGITQHIGAYSVKTKKGLITFLDTPGHEAFTEMRARGANCTDIVILVVAADDGVMPQTIEAINHAKAAAVPIVVAINKIDKPQIDVDRVKKQLANYGLVPEEWGGKTITIGVSAKTGEGIDHLLEMVLLEAEMLELKAPYDKLASGVVVEAKISKGRGPVATVLVQVGTLKVGDSVVCGKSYGKIRAMFNDLSERIDKVTPGIPAEILGLSEVPLAGEKFFALDDEKQAREIAERKKIQLRLDELSSRPKNITLEDLYNQIQDGQLKELNLIIKADTQGSVEAIVSSLKKLDTKEVKLNILHSAVGPINSSDVILAEASNAIIVGFHVEPETKAKVESETKNVEIRTYRIIYELISEIKAALEGLLEPKIKKVFLGKAEIRRVFDLSKAGKVAGCFVSKGKITRTAFVKLLRGSDTIFDGKLSSLKRFKDDVKEVPEGYECGLSFEGFTDFKEGDTIEAYLLEKTSRKL